MAHRLGHAVEHQPDAHAGGEQHREPARIAVIGRRVGPPSRTEPQGQTIRNRQNSTNTLAAQEEPVEVGGERRPQPAEDLAACSGRKREEHEGDDASPEITNTGLWMSRPNGPTWL
jgi:hypothetical protein